MVINENTGEKLASAGFFQWQEIDKKQFLDLYINGVKALNELTGPGTKVFENLYRTVQEVKGTDRVFLAYALVDQKLVKVSESTYYSGMKGLVKKGFVAEKTVQNSYFINPDFILNGERLSFFKSYILAKSSSPKKMRKE